MEFLVEFEVKIPEGTPESEIKRRENAEAVAAAKLVDEGHLVRLWRPCVATGEPNVLGLYRAGGETELDMLLSALPLSDWMRVTITPLGQHPNDPEATGSRPTAATSQPSPAANRSPRWCRWHCLASSAAARRWRRAVPEYCRASGFDRGWQ